MAEKILKIVVITAVLLTLAACNRADRDRREDIRQEVPPVAESATEEGSEAPEAEPPAAEAEAEAVETTEPEQGDLAAPLAATEESAAAAQLQGGEAAQAEAAAPAEAAEEDVSAVVPGEQTAPSQTTPVVRTVGLVAGPIDDRGFNQLAWEGLQRAKQEMGVNVEHLETSNGEAEASLNQFLSQGVAAIVTVGADLAQTAKASSEANPTIPFISVDFPSQTQSDIGLLFATDEPAFMAGYLAAGMTETGTVCTFGGRPSLPVLSFMVGFENGVEYYNQTNSADVQLLGWETDPTKELGGEGTFIGNFSDQEAGRMATEQFADSGCDIVLPVAGEAGLGAAAAAQSRDLKVIGVDADQTQTVPEYADVYLTSILKRIDTAVFDTIQRWLQGTAFQGTVGNFRNNYIGDLENGGVDLAPFHNFDSQVPQQLRDNLATIRGQIISGELSTGWPIQAEQAPAAKTAPDIAASGPALASAPALTSGGDSLSLSDLQNAEYTSEWTTGGTARLSGGEYRERAAPGSAMQTVIRLVETTFGDLDGDGAEDAAVVLATNGGGSGTFYDLAIVLNQNGEPVHVTSTSLGDRIKLNSLSIENEQVVVDYIGPGPNDPACCPTQAVVKRFGLQPTLQEQEPAGASPAAVAGSYTMTKRGAGGPIMITLTLGEDGRAQMSSDYQNGEPPIDQSGVWRSADSSVTITFDDINGRPFNEEITFEWQAGRLVSTIYDETVYGSEGLIFEQQ